MTLGETIAGLRSRRGMSQGALAEELEVSRQSVSKWETDASVPELDKLVKLAKLFDVTLDELVMGEETPRRDTPPPQVIIVEKERPRERRITVGWILLAAAFLVVLLFALMAGDPWVGALFALPLIFCGLIFLLVRWHPGLVALWLVGFLMDVYLRLATGITWRYIFLTPHFEASMNYMRLATGWAQFFYMVLTCGATVWRLRCGECQLGKRGLVLGWAAFAAAFLAVHFLSGAIPLWYYGWTDWLLLGSFTALTIQSRPSQTKA